MSRDAHVNSLLRKHTKEKQSTTSECAESIVEKSKSKEKKEKRNRFFFYYFKAGEKDIYI